MLIQELFTPDAAHVADTDTLQHAAELMRDRHVGALLVTQPGPGGTRAVGVVTDRDIVIGAVAAGSHPGAATVAEVMCSGIHTIDVDSDVSDALQSMLDHGVRRLAVSDGKALIGMLSLDDLLQGCSTEWAALAGILRSEQAREAALGPAPHR